MKITRTTTLASGVEDVFAIIATQEHQRAKVSAQAKESSATVTDLGGGLVGVHTERVVPTRGMPGPVVSLVGETLTVTEQQTWRPANESGSRTADLEINVEGAPVHLRGTIALSPAPAGSRLVVDADLTCSVPLLGRKVEAAAMPTIEESFDLEARLLSERLR